MTTYKVNLFNNKDLDVLLDVSTDRTIHEVAEAAGVDLPVSCRAGSCSSCIGQIISGRVDQTKQSFLNDQQLAAGFVLTCVAYPLTHCIIKTHQEGKLY
jgi:ferredoxin